MKAPVLERIKLCLACVPAAAVLFLSPQSSMAVDESLTYTVELPPVKTTPAEWGRDPFIPLLMHVSAPDMALTAIFYNSARPSAIINSRIVYVGSVINNQKIIDIGRTHVILHGVSGKIRLELASLPELTDGDEKP